MDGRNYTMWYKYTAPNAETIYGWTTRDDVVAAALAHLNKERMGHSPGYTAEAIPAGEAHDLELERADGLLHDDDTLASDLGD